MRKLLVRLAVPILVAGLAPLIAMTAVKPAAAAGPCGTVSTAPAYTHVIWIWMENHSYSDIIGNTSQAPYINSIAGECGLATNYHNLSHPSLPNYVGGTSGLAVSSLTPFDPDCNPSGSCNPATRCRPFPHRQSARRACRSHHAIRHPARGTADLQSANCWTSSCHHWSSETRRSGLTAK